MPVYVAGFSGVVTVDDYGEVLGQLNSAFGRYFLRLERGVTRDPAFEKWVTWREARQTPTPDNFD